ncbi:MAG: hypothetical protein ABJH26_08280, partial [Marinomonas sp.]
MTLRKPTTIALALCLLAAPIIPAAAQDDKDTQLTKTAPTSPPIAEKREHTYTHHGITISDPYHWLKDQSYPVIDDEDVLDYVKAENAWFEAKMEGQKALTDELFKEMKARIKEDDSSVPQKDGDYIYWSAFEDGAQYRKHYRKPAAGGDDQLMLDENALAKGLDYFRLGAMSVSKSGRYLAYSTDTNGAERYTARIKDLQTGELLPDEIPETRTGLTWVANDTGIVYGKSTKEWRTLAARLYTIGTSPDQDVILYEEADESFSVGSGLSAQEDWLIIATGDNETSEVRLVPADNPTAEPILVKARQKGVEYSVDVRTDATDSAVVYIWTNDDHINFRLASASIKRPSEWNTVIAGSDDFYLTGFDLFKDFMVTEGRLNGLDQIQLRQYDAPGDITPIAFPEASYDAGLGNNPEYDVDTLRLGYESMVTPDT